MLSSFFKGGVWCLKQFHYERRQLVQHTEIKAPGGSLNVKMKLKYIFFNFYIKFNFDVSENNFRSSVIEKPGVSLVIL